MELLDQTQNVLFEKVSILVERKKAMYGHIDISEPMSASEKKLTSDIADLWSRINAINRYRKQTKRLIRSLIPCISLVSYQDEAYVYKSDNEGQAFIANSAGTKTVDYSTLTIIDYEKVIR